MAELHVIAAELRRQWKDIDELLESTSKRSGQTAELITKIEQLRQRALISDSIFKQRIPTDVIHRPHFLFGVGSAVLFLPSPA